MKRLIIPLCLIIGISLFQCKKKDPCPDLGGYSGVGLYIKIVDRNTGQDMIGANRPFLPDSVKLIDILRSYTSRPRISYQNTYFLDCGLPFANIDLILYLNKDDRDTIKVRPVGGTKTCKNQPPYKIYYKGDLIKETSGDDDIYEAINISIKK